jgi:AsmA-like C-terminal region
VHAIGRISAGRVLLHSVLATRVSADVDLEQGLLHLTNLQGEVLGGKHRGEWTADFTASPPTYAGNGILENVALEHVADAMHDAWITGIASAQYRANTAGWTRAELLAGAAATLQVDARDGSLPHLMLAGESAPLRMGRLVGRLSLHDGKIEIEGGKLQTPVNIYQLSGTASLDRTLDVKLAREGSRGFNITGTLTQPHVVINTSPETQAALKP